MNNLEAAETLYGLMQTWPASPQAPQVGNLVPHHIGFDVTTPSGSIFEAAISCPSWQTFHPFLFGYRREFSPHELGLNCAGIMIRMQTSVAGDNSMLESSNVPVDSPGNWSLCYRTHVCNVFGRNRPNSTTGEI